MSGGGALICGGSSCTVEEFEFPAGINHKLLFKTNTMINTVCGTSMPAENCTARNLNYLRHLFRTTPSVQNVEREKNVCLKFQTSIARWKQFLLLFILILRVPRKITILRWTGWNHRHGAILSKNQTQVCSIWAALPFPNLWITFNGNVKITFSSAPSETLFYPFIARFCLLKEWFFCCKFFQIQSQFHALPLCDQTLFDTKLRIKNFPMKEKCRYYVLRKISLSCVVIHY